MNARLVSSLLVLCTLALALALAAQVTRADSLSDAFARGNRAFSKADYASAVSEYQRLIESGVADPDVTFNLASAYGNLGRYGQAIRYFERTLTLRPSDNGATKALSEVRNVLGERTAQRTGEAIVSDRPPLSEALFGRLTTHTLAWLLLASVWLASLCGLALLRVQPEGIRLALGITCASASLLALVSGTGLGARLDWGQAEGRGIVLAETALREGPDTGAAMKSELSEGSPAKILSRHGAYLRVHSGSLEGYVLASEVGEI